MSCDECVMDMIPESEGEIHKCSKCGTTWISKIIGCKLKEILGVDFYWERV